MPQESSRQRSALSVALKAALALGVLAYLAYVIEPSRILETAAGARLGWVAAAAALLPLNLALEGAAWQRILTVAAPRTSWRAVYGALLCGASMGLVTPARAGEFVGRAFYVPHARRWETGATVFAQRLLDMTASIGVGLAALLYALQSGLLARTPAWGLVALVGAGITLSLAAMVLRPAAAARFFTAVPRVGLRGGAALLRGAAALGLPKAAAGSAALQRRARAFDDVPDQLAFLTRIRTGRLLQALGLSAARYVVFASQFVFLIFAFAPAVPLFKAYLGVSLVFFAKFLIPSVTLMDIGIREGAAVYFYGLLGVPEAAAFNAAFFIFCLNLLVPAALGLPFVLRMRLRREARPAARQDAPRA